MSNELPAGTVKIGNEYFTRHHRVLLSRGPRAYAELERDTRDGALGKVQVQRGLGAKVLVRITSFRKRLLDEDNLCEKYHVDLLRYSGVLPNDAPAQTKIECRQEKVGPKEPERVLIEVFRL